MNAKKTEELTGISRRNLRFYEDQGLIHPSRNPENDYRDYSEEEIKTLKTIRAHRMLDISLEEIRLYLKGSKTMDAITQDQEQVLRKKQKDLEAAIRFCQELRREPEKIDAILEQMDAPQVRETLFSAWARDYQSVARAEAQCHFYFVPDDAVTNAAEFSMALFAYADQEKKELVITREGMEPEFELNGIPYTAQRFYRPVPWGLPVAMITCDAKYPEDFAVELPRGKKRVLSFFYKWWWAFLVVGIDALVVVRTGVTELHLVLLMLLPSICTVWILAMLYRTKSK